MHIPKSIFLGISLSSLIGLAHPANAQLVPGFDEPETQLKAFEEAHNMACFLAVAGRPVPGINLDAPEIMGEGAFIESEAPTWLSDNLSMRPEVSFLRLKTGTGDIWIVFDKTNSTCTMAAKVPDTNDFRTNFVNEVFTNKDWKRKKDKHVQAGFYYRMKLDRRLTFKSTFLDVNDIDGVFIVQLKAD